MPHTTPVSRCLPAALALVAATAHAQVHREAIPLRSFTPLSASTFADRGDGVSWEGSASAPGALYLRLRFSEIVSPAGGSQRIVVRGADERTLVSYSADRFGAQSELWTPVLFSPSVTVHVHGEPPAGFSFKVDRVLRQADLQGRMTPQSILPSWKALDELGLSDPARPLAGGVAKLYVGEGYVCTGFLVSDRGVLTNHHCLEKSIDYQRTKDEPAISCSDIEVQFGFDLQPSPRASVRLSCRGVLARDAPLDFALLEVDQGATRRPVLALAPRAPASPEPVYVIHHPAGLAKKVSAGCQAFVVAEDRIEHDCSTVGGSSGSPMLAKDGMVVALHNEGAYPRTMTGEEIEAAIAEGKVFRNKAKPMHLIRPKLQGLLP